MRYDAVPLEIAGGRYFLRFSLGALLILQRRLQLASLSDVLGRVMGVMPGAAESVAEAADALQNQALRVNLDDLGEVLWAGLHEAGIADHYSGPVQLMTAVSPVDLPEILTKLGLAAALCFTRPESEAADAGNPPAAAPTPSR